MRITTLCLAAFGLGLAAIPGLAFCQTSSPRIEIGAGFLLLLGNGEPSNDMPSYGVSVRYQVNDIWTLGAALHTGEWDFERPATLLGIAQSPAGEAVDAKIAEESVSIWLESQFDGPFGWNAFWQLGGGAANGDATVAAGPTATGGRFSIVTDPGTTPFAFGALGLRRGFAQHWYWESSVRLEQHFADLRFVDTVSGRSGKVDSFLLRGGYIGFGYTF